MIFTKAMWKGDSFELNTEERKMAEEIKQMENQMATGSWGTMSMSNERKDQVKVLNVGEEHGIELVFQCDEPKEIPLRAGGVFYIFDVTHEGVEKDLPTSSWTLLRGLKPLVPLSGKRIKIWKELKEGRQSYCVKDLDVVEEEAV